MKKVVLSLMTLMVLSATQSLTLAKSTTIKKYDSHGNYQGRFVSEGNKTKEYTKSGNYKGYYEQDGNKIKQYNKNGNLEGTYKKAN